MARSDRFTQFLRAGQPNARLFRNQAGNPLNADDCPEASRCLKAVIKNEADSDCIEILLHDYIGDSWTGTDSASVARTLSENRGKVVRFNVNSFGGSAYDGIAIYNAAAQHDARVEAVVTGIAHSAAGLIVMAADVIKIAENGSLGVHPASMGTWGNRFTMMDSAKWLETLDQQIVDTYVARTGMSEKDVLALFIGDDHDGTILSGKEAVAKGFADELIPLKKKPATNEGKSTDEFRQRLEKRAEQWEKTAQLTRIQELRKRIAERQ